MAAGLEWCSTRNETDSRSDETLPILAEGNLMRLRGCSYVHHVGPQACAWGNPLLPASRAWGSIEAQETRSGEAIAIPE